MNDNHKHRAYIAADYDDDVSGRNGKPHFKPKWMNITIYLFWPIAFWVLVIWYFFG